MTRLRHSVVLGPVPKDWFDEKVGLGHEIVGEALGTELPLVGGEHLSPNSWYGDDGLQVTVESWRRDGETSGTLHLSDERWASLMSVRLVSAESPRLAEVGGDVRSMSSRWLGRIRGCMRVDIERWWHAVSGKAEEPAVEGKAKHGMVGVSFTLTPSAGPDGRWTVTADVRLRSRGVLAPFTALGLLLGRSAIRRGFRDAAERFAAEWNREVPALLALSAQDLRERFIAELTNARS
ncbi:hypothetical protein [Actinophytocola oryzae]|uniref:Uncharacterized protein n=1 Tax=Actinophytocola oryzae TaxID=502181 RepID=A0A4R7V1A1_9PSEU|nr:hypothetical protein [Actinophytocola oryzae]TDV42252.1 hypothetical protein CLV71_118122 [Actinophytocola oryzae]